MDTLQMISHYRSLKGGDEEAQVIVGRLVLSDLQTFHSVGGLENPEVRLALQTETDDTISAARPYLIFNGKEVIQPTAYIDGKVCKVYPASEKGWLAANYTHRPAAVIEGSCITFYPEGDFTSGTKTVRVAYVRNLRRILFLGGYSVEGGTSQYGIKDKPNLVSFKFIWPSERPSFVANELAGATLSVQWNNVIRRDYRVEENEAGALSRVFVNTSYAAVESPLPEPLDSRRKGMQAILHRSSDLPPKYHAMIVERAAGIVPQEEAKK